MPNFELRPIDNRFEAPRLDITIWNLQSFLATQRFIVDVALQVCAPVAESISTLRLEVPFQYDRVQDLTNLKSENYPSWLSAHKDVQLATSRVSDAQPVGRAVMPGPLVRRRRVSTELTVQLDTALTNGAQALVLLRFHATIVSFALWKRSLLGINGVILSTGIETAVPNKQLVVPAERGFHIVLRASLQPQLTFPRSVVPALVDESDWNNYLGRRPDLRGEGALVVLSNTTSGDEPPQIYIDASREFGLLPLGNFIRILLISLFSTYFILWLRDKGVLGPRSPSAGNILGRIGDALSLRNAQAQILWFKVGGLVAVIVVLVLLRKPLLRAWSAIRLWLRKSDDWFLKKQSK